MDANQIVQFALLGLGAGAAYALLGQGVIVVYRGSGIVNFAQGAMAIFGAFIYWDLRVHGGWPFWPAILVAMAAVGLVGLAFQALVLQRMTRASPITRLIATLGLMSVLTAVATLRWGTQPQLVSSPLPVDTWKITTLGLDVVVPANRIYLFGIAALLTLGLWAFYRFTTFGLAVTAAAENERAASALAWSPERLARVNWFLGGLIATIAGVLIVPTSGLQVNTGTALLIAALAAALLGGFRSFPATLLGGLLIGIVQSELARFGTDIFGATGQVGIAASLPFLIIIVVLVVRGRSLPLRSHVLEKLPRLGSGILKPIPVVTASVVLVVLDLTVLGQNETYALMQMLFASIMILSLVVLTGYTGQLSLGQYALGGMGAFFAGRLVTDSGFLSAGLPFELAFFLGIAGATLVGLLFALPALRTRGVNLAVVTLGLGLAVQAMLFSNPKYTGGSDGTAIGETKLFGYSIDAVAHPDRYLIFCLFWLLVAVVIVSNLRRSGSGRRLIAVRTNERAAASLGISVVSQKLFAFAVSAAIAGLGGILIGFAQRNIVFETFSPFASINAVVEAVIGGIGYVSGFLFGSPLHPGSLPNLWLGDLISNAGAWLVLAGGVILIVQLMFNPDGIAQKCAETWNARRKRSLRPVVPLDIQEPDDGVASVERVTPEHLAVKGLTVRFGSVSVLENVNLEIKPGEIVGLIGPNGAGKTTFIDAVTGFVKVTAGEVSLSGTSIASLSPTRRARRGLTRSFQSLELFEDISVQDNMLAACDSRRWTGYLRDLLLPQKRRLSSTAMAAIREFGLEKDLGATPHELPYGQRRILGIARAVATQPSVLLLDEPAAGLSDLESTELADLVRRLANDWGLAVLLVEHDMNFVMSICDRIVVLEYGRKIAEGTPREITTDPAVIAAYLGDSTTSEEDVVVSGPLEVPR